MPTIPVLDKPPDEPKSDLPEDSGETAESAERFLRQQRPDDDDLDYQPKSENQTPQQEEEKKEDKNDQQDRPKEKNDEKPDQEQNQDSKEAAKDAERLKDKFGGKNPSEAATPAEGAGGTAGGAEAAGGGAATGGAAVAGGGAATGGAATGGAVAAGGAAAATSPIWGLVAIVVGIVILVIVLIVIFLAALCGPLGICGSGDDVSSAEETGAGSTIPGSGVGVIDDFCQGYRTSCSGQLRTIIEGAASWAKMPAAILVTVGLAEWSLAYSLSDEEVRQGSDPGASVCSISSVIQYYENQTETVFCAENRSPEAGSTDFPAGPMQFRPSTWAGANYTYGNASVEAGKRKAGYTGEIFNLLDSYYAAAKYLKLNAGMNLSDPVKAWTSEEFSSAIKAYGTCTLETTPGSGVYEFNQSCADSLYQRYIDKSLTFVADGTNPSITSWPVSGVNKQSPYCINMVSACISHSDKAAVDISGNDGASVYATQDGVLRYGDDGNTNYGKWAKIEGANYNTLYAHLNRDPSKASPCESLAGQVVKAGTFLGIVDSTGESTGPHLHYEILDTFNKTISAADFTLLFPPGYDQPDATLSNTAYSGKSCLQ